MKLSDLNEYVQTVAALGAIVALLTVGFEIRESNRIATQSAISTNWSNWIEYSANELETGISNTLAKSMTTPEELTLNEKIDMDAYLSKFIYAYHHDYLVSLYETGEVHETGEELSIIILQELAGDVPKMFGSRFSRAWFEENKSWMEPSIAAVIEQTIEHTPIGSDLDYYNRIDTMAAAI
jgi:hypothetical protein